MLSIRMRLAAVVGCVAVALATAAPAAFADSVATTGGVTEITSTSAVLHGVANPTDKDSVWLFQYGTSTSYAKTSHGAAISGPSVVQEKVAGLSPGTVYHYRLVVIQGSYNPTYTTGNDLTFTTALAGSGGGGGGGPGTSKSGTGSLKSHKLLVSGGSVAIPLTCSGKRGAKCSGKLSLTAKGKQCASGKFSIGAGKSATLHPSVSGKCMSLLRKAPGHKLGATLNLTFSTHQSPLKQAVTLLLG